jgi:proline iminopeptidase
MTIPPPSRSGTTASTPVPLYWAEWGAPEQPPLLLLHGGPGAHHDYLLPQMLALTATHRVVTYDQRGGGRSRTDAPEPITWRTQVADLARVAAELCPEGAPTVVGYSWGALLAMLAAIEAAAGRPGLTPRALALVSPAGIARRDKDDADRTFAARAASPAVQAMRANAAASPLKVSDPDRYRRLVFEAAVAPWFFDPQRAEGLTPFRLVEKVQKSIWESLGDYDLTTDLATVHTPALVVAGREDPIPVASAVRIATALRAECVVLDACGHVPYVEAAPALFGALHRFLTSTSGAA